MFVLIFIFLFNLVFSFGGLMIAGISYGLSFAEARYLISQPDGTATAINVLRLYHFISFSGYMFLPALFFSIANRSSLSIEGGLNIAVKPRLALMAAGIALTGIPLINWINQVMRGIQWPVFLKYYADRLDSGRQELSMTLLDMQEPHELLICLLLVALLPAFCEEVLFRGIFMKIFHGITGSIVRAVFLQALVFAVLHFSFYELPAIYIMGAAAGIMVMATGSTVYGMIMHFIFNGVTVILHYLSLLNFRKTGISDAYDEIHVPFSFALLAAVPFTYLIVLFIRHYKKQVHGIE